MAAGAAIVWLAVMGVAVYAVVKGRTEHSGRTTNRFILIGGVLVPTVVLAVLLAFGLSALPDLLRPAEGGATIRVSAEQWWWRVEQEHAGRRFPLANEIRLPVGRRTSIEVVSPDVVHSLWIPALAGKVDAIPGRTTILTVEPTRTGAFAGLCAEYCGSSHARMLFEVVVMEPEAYDAWARAQMQDAADHEATDLFMRRGCGGCHRVRGTAAPGGVGPDLTHVGSRRTVAGVLDNDAAGFEAWLRAPDEHKPGAHMPAYDMLPDADIGTLAAYLESLK